ncbi:MAG: hypothetical protein H6724_06020 [Sandaracinus sp.]|nr:hypothetical protein [Sandaracinus sp.]
MASWYGTQFVGTERLARATVDPHALQLVPKRLAERLRICPVLWNARSRTLAVVAIDLTRDDVAKQVQMVAADLRKVTVLVARPAAIEASIRKHYDCDPRAFALLLRSAGTPSPGFDGNGMGGGGFGDLPGFGDSDAGGGFGGGGFGGGGFWRRWFRRCRRWLRRSRWFRRRRVRRRHGLRGRRSGRRLRDLGAPKPAQRPPCPNRRRRRRSRSTLLTSRPTFANLPRRSPPSRRPLVRACFRLPRAKCRPPSRRRCT